MSSLGGVARNLVRVWLVVVMAVGWTMAIGTNAADAQSFRFSQFQIEGNLRVDDASVLEIAGLEPGAAISGGGLNDAAQRLRNSGLFETVSVAPRGATLDISVVEFPTINRIAFEGNRRLDDSELLAVIRSAPRRVYSPATAEADTNAIVTAYQSSARLAATVRPSIIRRSDNRVDLVFSITEGRVVENERISFVGNRNFSDNRLRRVIQTKQANALRQLIRVDTFVEERIPVDRQLLTDFYNSRGYIDFQILDVTTEFSRERNASFITFNVREGQSFSIGDVSVVSMLPEVEASAFDRQVRLRSGQTFSPVSIDATVSRMEEHAIDLGLDFVRVDPVFTRNDRSLTLDVEFRIVRGERIFVERIDIEGNATTLDRVIRRQFTSVEGDPFNPRAIRAAAERIRALGFFATADVVARGGSTQDQVVVDVDVVEQPTGSLSFGAAYSNESGVGFLFNFSERNFLGRGQSLSFEIVTASEDRAFEFSFSEPALLGRDVRFTFDAFADTTDFANLTYETETIGLGGSLTFPIGELSQLTVGYEIARLGMTVDPDASAILLAEDGTDIRSALSYNYTYNNSRGAVRPDTILSLRFGQEFAGIGGDVQYVKTTAGATATRAVLNEEVTLSASLSGGVLSMLGDDPSRAIDRFFSSSANLRGFESRGIGPRDTDSANGDPLGGNMFVNARVQADFPLGLPEEIGLSGAVFIDAGSIWGLDNTDGDGGPGSVDDSFELRSAAGIALLLDTPFGPFQFNFAKPISSNPNDQEQSFSISISTRF